MEATFAINACVSGLFHEGVFIPAAKAEQLANKGLLFLRKYIALAEMCFKNRQKRFALMPKGHYLHHQFLGLLHSSKAGPWSLNILVFSNQMSEDFVGKPSRISRRVSAKTTSLRVIQRAFLSIRHALCSHLDNFELGPEKT